MPWPAEALYATAGRGIICLGRLRHYMPRPVEALYASAGRLPPPSPSPMGGVTPIKPCHKKSDDEESFFGEV